MSLPYHARRRRNRMRVLWCIIVAGVMALGALAAPYLLVAWAVAR